MAQVNDAATGDREEGCFATTAERKYYHRGDRFCKRSLRPNEWIVAQWNQKVHVPRLGKERLLNEAAALKYVRENTNVPVPRLYGVYEEDDAVTVETEYVDGVGMNELSKTQRRAVEKELERHLQTLRGLRSSKIGGPSGLVVPPYRVTLRRERDDWILKEQNNDELVFCHNDLSMHNVIVDPETLKITAIVDWEYAGFYPAFFERRFFLRKGPSVALEGEDDDSIQLVKFLKAQLVRGGTSIGGL